MKRCRDCKWRIEVNFNSLVGDYCPKKIGVRWWSDSMAEFCKMYTRKWWKIWREK